MRKSKKVTLGDREITVYELRVKDIRELIDAAGKDLTPFALLDRLSLFCDLAAEDFEELTPSAVKDLWDAFTEVNAVFFEWTAKAGILDVLKNTIRDSLNEAFAELSKPDTETPPSTGTAFSSSPSKKPAVARPNG